MSQFDSWKDGRRAMHPAAPRDPNPRPPVKPMHEWAADGVALLLVNAAKLATKEYLRLIGELSPARPAP